MTPAGHQPEGHLITAATAFHDQTGFTSGQVAAGMRQLSGHGSPPAVMAVREPH
jgi:hypothetical protein